MGLAARVELRARQRRGDGVDVDGDVLVHARAHPAGDALELGESAHTAVCPCDPRPRPAAGASRRPRMRSRMWPRPARRSRGPCASSSCASPAEGEVVQAEALVRAAETENAAAARRGCPPRASSRATREPGEADARVVERRARVCEGEKEGGGGRRGEGEWRQTRRRERAREGKNPQPEKATRVDNVRTATYRPETRARMRRPPRDASVGGRGANARDRRVRARGRALERPPRRRHARGGREAAPPARAPRDGENHRGAEDLNPQPRRGDRGRDRARPRRGGARRTCATVADAPMDAIVKDAIMSKVELGRLRAPRDSNARRRRRGAAEKATKRARLDEMGPRRAGDLIYN